MSNLIGVHVDRDGFHFVAVAPCGQSWLGMRHSDDVRIVLDRAMDHVPACPDCRTIPAPVYATRPAPPPDVEWVHECGQVIAMPPDWTPVDGGCDACESGSPDPSDWKRYTRPGPPHIVERPAPVDQDAEDLAALSRGYATEARRQAAARPRVCGCDDDGCGGTCAGSRAAR